MYPGALRVSCHSSDLASRCCEVSSWARRPYRRRRRLPAKAHQLLAPYFRDGNLMSRISECVAEESREADRVEEESWIVVSG